MTSKIDACRMQCKFSLRYYRWLVPGRVHTNWLPWLLSIIMIIIFTSKRTHTHTHTRVLLQPDKVAQDATNKQTKKKTFTQKPCAQVGIRFFLFSLLLWRFLVSLNTPIIKTIKYYDISVLHWISRDVFDYCHCNRCHMLFSAVRTLTVYTQQVNFN